MFVSGSSSGRTGVDYLTFAYDSSTGEQLWQARHHGPDGRDAYFQALDVSPGGDLVFVTGRFTGSTPGETVAYDASTGAQVWVQGFGGRVTDRRGSPRDLAVSPDGTMLFVTGSQRVSGGSQDYATVAYLAATGERVWTKRYDGRGADGSDWAQALAVAPDGGTLFVTGTIDGKAYGYATLAYDAATGSKVWTARHGWGDLRDISPAEIAVSADGTRVFLTGSNFTWTTKTWWTSSDTLAYDAATGDEVWEVRSGGELRVPGYTSSLVVSPDGSTVFVTGSGSGPTSTLDYVTTALDASSGTVLWDRHYHGGGDYAQDVAFSMALSADGSTVFVTGASGPWRDPDYATVAYDASSGAELWHRRFEGPRDGRDSARSIAVSPDGSRVFVTGESDAAGGTSFATVAYSA